MFSISKHEKQFIFFSCAFSLIQALLYFYLGLLKGFNQFNIIIVTADLFYIPVLLLLKSPGLRFYFPAYSLLLLYTTSSQTTELYNNFSALLCLFVGVLCFPKYKIIYMSLYLFASAVAMMFNNETIIDYLIHASRAVWIYSIYDFIIYYRYDRKPVILTEDERAILSQLVENKLQKEIELNGLSERTIRRRLDAAKERNGLKTTEELKELYLKTYKAGCHKVADD